MANFPILKPDLESWVKEHHEKSIKISGQSYFSVIVVMQTLPKKMPISEFCTNFAEPLWPQKLFDAHLSCWKIVYFSYESKLLKLDINFFLVKKHSLSDELSE